MTSIYRRIATLIIALTLLAGCDQNTPAPQPTPTSAPVVPQSATPAPPTPTSAPVRQPGRLFPAGLTNEALAVVSTSPADKSEDNAVTKDRARIVVQFNHPVVPLVSVAGQKDLPQPLTFQPAIQGAGEWLNTATYVYTPGQDLTAATTYTVAVKSMTDALGQSLASYAFAFKTTAPAIARRSPDDNSVFAGPSQGITVTFNTPMDTASVESRFRLLPPQGGGATGRGVGGRFEWNGPVMRFVADPPLDYDTSYSAILAAGAQDINKVAATKADVRWQFRTIKKPEVSGTAPKDGSVGNREIRSGFTLTFTSPMDKEALKLTVAPTITNQYLDWQFNANDTILHIRGNWQASQAYTVTVNGDSRGRYGDKLGKEFMARFVAPPLDPSLTLNVTGIMGMYDALGAQLIYASYVNLEKIEYSLYRVDREDFLRMAGRNAYQNFNNFRPAPANRMRDWSQAVSTPLNSYRVISTTLTTGAPLDAGVYYVEARSPSVREADRHLLVVSGLNLALKRGETEALVWATSLQTGKPVANQPVALYGPDNKVIAQGKTDANGVFRGSFPRVEPFEPIFALSESDGRVVAATGSDWNDGIGGFDYQLPMQYGSQEFYANLYTDRPVYRPGQTVYYKGILRRDNDATYSIPSDVISIPIKVRDSEGKAVLSQNVTLDRFGAFDGQVVLSEAARTGYYNINFELGAANRKYFGSVGFTVAEYRKPEFQVDVKTNKAEYANGETINLDAATTYFFGGPVADAKVQWRLLSDDYFFRPTNVKGYWDFVDTDLLLDRKRTGGVIREGKGTTDKAGNFHADVTADLRDYPLSQNFTLEVEVADINNQSVASRVTVPVHKGQIYIGLKPQKYLGTAGQEQAVDVLTVNSQGLPVASQNVSVSVYRRTWYSAREKREDGQFYWTSHYSDTLLTKQNVLTSAQGAGAAKFTPAAGGIYRIVADATDGAGNAVRSATTMWVFGSQFVNWRVDNNDRIELVSDKKQYDVGETAEILIPAPFAGGEALITIERGGILEVRRLTMAGNSEKLSVPIRAEYTPNVYVSVMLVKGRTGIAEPAQFKMGYASLDVATTQKELTVKITADKPQYAPGDKATLNIDATDGAGKPVEAEFSLAMVDKAVQSLMDEQSTPLVDAFYGRRGLAIQTATTLVRSVERLNQTVQRDAKGGGGGGGPAAAVVSPVRRDFRDTAYWNANVTTNAQGRAQVTTPLPDNLTTWNVRVKGVTAGTLVGDTSVDILSTKDLLLRPVTPRFVVTGDKARIEAVVNNNTANDITADVSLDAQGLVIAGSAKQAVTIKAKDKAKVSWDTVVGTAQNVVAKFSVTGGGLSDAAEYTLPVNREISPETVATAGQVDTKLAEQIKLPAGADRAAGELQIETSPSLAAASRSGLKYLETYSTACTEFTISRFFPNAATVLSLKKMGLERPELQKQLEAAVSRDVQRLYTLQNLDGGWGWCQSDESQPMLTAYALMALSTAQRAGFAVDATALNRAEQFLTKYLDKPVDAKLGYAYNERAFVVFALTEIGRNMTSRAVNLYEQRASLGAYGKAYLLMTLHALKQPQAQTLVAELSAAALPSATGTHWEEAKADYRTMNTNTRSTALVVMALSRADPKNALLAGAVRWLMVARKQGHWETTQETAWSVLALTEYMQASGELSGNYTYQVLLNGKLLGGDNKVDKSTIDQPVSFTVPVKDLLLDTANELLITRGAGDGKLYYSANLQYYLSAENIPALNRGVIVGRQYYAVDQATLKPTSTAIASAKVGDYVQVRLVIVAPTDLHYLVVEDAMPAGFEAVDNTLKTTSVAVQGGQLDTKPDPALASTPYARPYWTYWVQTDVRDDRVKMYATYLGRGVYEYTYMLRASLAGDFHTLPARAWQTYAPDVMGRSASTSFQVLP
ncbi:MAG: Ig-like domain-containing protein [Chloroflexi bacterium]|nr:Ig-like domain-containing protein [Chloroflexota bacterium]